MFCAYRIVQKEEKEFPHFDDVRNNEYCRVSNNKSEDGEEVVSCVSLFADSSSLCDRGS